MSAFLGFSICAVSLCAAVSPEIPDFQKRVGDYLKVRKTADSSVGTLKTTDSAEKIEQHQLDLAQAIRTARPHAAHGEIFTHAIAARFRHAIRHALSVPGAYRVKKGVTDTHLAPLPLVAVDAAYPKESPVQSMPPSLLAALPELPHGLEYRFVGRTLILLDKDANLIVDYVNEALP